MSTSTSASAVTIVIGLEVHVQLKTRTKLFCGCTVEFRPEDPNSQTCPVCLGLPGTLPVMNRQAFQLAMTTALALNCSISRETRWDRKQYYYPDLPKAYQISQYDQPFSSSGWLEITADDPQQLPRRIRITRAHLEEDAGKNVHDESGRGGDSRVDLNRAGTPLLEIVSEPDLRSAGEARRYLESLRGAVEKAMKYEAQRQYEQFKKDGKKFGEIPKATAGWDESRGVTVVQRRKEEASDYRYFPEPDLVPVKVSTSELETAKNSLGELPSVSRERLVGQYGLSKYDASVLVSQGKKFLGYFEETASKCNDPKASCNWVTNQVLSTLNEQKKEIQDFEIKPERLAGLIREVQSIGLNMQRAREVYADMLSTGSEAKASIEKLGFKVVADLGQITEIVKRAIASNPKAVADFKKGKVKAADAIKGAVMRETKGMAKTETVQEIVMKELTEAKEPE